MPYRIDLVLPIPIQFRYNWPILTDSDSRSDYWCTSNAKMCDLNHEAQLEMVKNMPQLPFPWVPPVQPFLSNLSRG